MIETHQRIAHTLMTFHTVYDLGEVTSVTYNQSIARVMADVDDYLMRWVYRDNLSLRIWMPDSRREMTATKQVDDDLGDVLRSLRPDITSFLEDT